MITEAEFLRDRGSRCTIDGKSIILNSLTSGERLTKTEQSSLAEIQLTYLAGVQGMGTLSFKGSRLLNGSAALPRGADEGFKFVRDSDMEYWRRGSIQVSSIQRYREIEEAGARDVYEGMGFVAMNHEKFSTVMGIQGGFSNYVLCLSNRASDSGHMASRFGRNLVRIRGLHKFASKVAALLGAESFRIADVRYSDHKMISIEDSTSTQIRAVLSQGSPHEMNDAQIMKIAGLFFPTLREIADNVTTFCKPLHFKDENERRISFSMPYDVREPTKVVESKELLSHLTFIG